MRERTANDLQFDRADYVEEFENEADLEEEWDGLCGFCRSELRGHYYLANGEAVCESCRRDVEARDGEGRSSDRFLKATGLGIVAGTVGAAIYFAVSKVTGYEIGLVAIVVGFLVGNAVRIGSGARGGWAYQTLAMALTYVAIAASYVPFIIEGVEDEASQSLLASSESANIAKITITADKSVLLNGSPVSLAELDAELLRVSEAGGQVWYHRVGMADERPGATADEVAELVWGRGMVLLPFTDPDFQERESWQESMARRSMRDKLASSVMLLAVGAMIPFLSLPDGFIGLLIIGFALWEAWRVNRKLELEIEGPFEVSERAAVGLSRTTQGA